MFTSDDLLKIWTSLDSSTDIPNTRDSRDHEHNYRLYEFNVK